LVRAITLAHGGPPGHDPVVVAEPDPLARHVQPVRVKHEVHGSLGPDRPVCGGVPADQEFVVPQPEFSAPVVAAFFLAEPSGDRGDLEQVAFLFDLYLLGCDLFLAPA
jgi:hypothetical protein